MALLVATQFEYGASVTPFFGDTRVGQFMRLNPLTFIGVRVEDDPQSFLDKIQNIFYLMHATNVEGVEFSTYQLKDMAYQWYEE